MIAAETTHLVSRHNLFRSMMMVDAAVAVDGMANQTVNHILKTKTDGAMISGCLAMLMLFLIRFCLFFSYCLLRLFLCYA
jgi:hypothetical protein